MHIPDDTWDKVVSDALEMVESLENLPPELYVPLKAPILSFLYNLIHTETSKSEIEEINNMMHRLDAAVNRYFN